MIVAVDYFSKSPFAKALRDAKADTVVSFFNEKIVSQFGTSGRITSDRGPAFTSHPWKNEMVGKRVEHALCTTEHAHSNCLKKAAGVLVERLAALPSIVSTNGTVFSPQRSPRSTSTKFSPFQIVFGFRPVFLLKNQIKIIKFLWPEEG